MKRLPLDQLKINQSFARYLLSDGSDAAIAKPVIVLADGMGLMVITEGIEIESQRHFLAHMGCHAYQGYLVQPAGAVGGLRGLGTTCTLDLIEGVVSNK